MKSKEQKHAEAKVRNEERAQRNGLQQLKKLDEKFGIGKGAKKERQRLGAREGLKKAIEAGGGLEPGITKVVALEEVFSPHGLPKGEAVVLYGPSKKPGKNVGKKPGSPKGDPANHRLRATASE